MFVRYVPPTHLDAEIAMNLAESAIYDHKSPAEFLSQLDAGDMKVFVVDHGGNPVYIAVSVLYSNVRVLQLEGMWVQHPGRGIAWRSWLDTLRALAREWNCVRVETAVKDVAIAEMLVRMGCKIDHVAIALEV